ncbi:MAG: autotransporter assembly complex family protein [Gammaproteobacteria bacterium]|nr:autotransporter assembly complex family protein [Gammaproteobacteria bacterium]
MLPSWANPGVFESVIANHPLRTGERFDHETYEAFKSRIGDIATRYGFLEGRFTHSKVTVDAQENRADIDLVYDPARRFHFGEIRYPNDVLDEDVLRRYRTFEPGDPYDARRLSELYRDLVDTSYFEDVIVTPMVAEDDRIPVRVLLVPGRTRDIRVGIGVSTDFGPNLLTRLDNHLVNRSGHQYSIDLSLSPVETKLGASYRIPQADRANGWLSAYGGFQQEDTQTSQTRSTTLGIRRVIPRDKGWVETLFLEFNRDRFDISGVRETSDYIMPGINFTHTRNDARMARPRRGHRLSFEVTGTSRAIGSSVDFASARLEGRLIHSLTSRIRLLGRARMGITQSDDFEKLPPRVRFFSGGDARVRGFDFEAIGVEDEDGAIIGGDRLLEFSAEIDHAIGEQWAVAAFTDAASVSLDTFSTDFRRSVGVGVRWYSPVGPLRLDIAKPVDSRGGGFRLHISLGPDV